MTPANIRQHNTGTEPDKHDTRYTSYGNGHENSGTHLVGSCIAASTDTPQNALGSKQVGNTNDMTTTTPTGNHGDAVVSCSPYAHPGFAEIRTLH